MKAIIPDLSKNDNRPFYIQLYNYIKDGIRSNDLKGREKLPSIRNLAGELKISVTTVSLAYQQLLVEGYIYSKPQSGYYINDIRMPESVGQIEQTPSESLSGYDFETFDNAIIKDESKFLNDPEAFNFVKWKKALTKILNDYSDLLLSEGNPQGEYSLRHEIFQYLYRVRGIKSRCEDIIIGAGTQQLTGQLSKLILLDGISDLIIEKPGYDPVHSIFSDYGIKLHPAKVEKDGISLEYIPVDLRSAIYTSPSNQFPTGAVMPAGKRYDLLRLAALNDSYIIEDDYDSELRYFGQPIPPLKSLDRNDSVIYLSSFSSTLFPAIKISYMVLPAKLSAIFKKTKNQYTQTCSKTEQLALAYFMENGSYHTNVRKLRRLYAQKLQITINAFKKYAPDIVTLIHSSSGVNMLIEVNTEKTTEQLVNIATSMGISTEAVKDGVSSKTQPRLILHFYRIPVNDIDFYIKSLSESWS